MGMVAPIGLANARAFAAVREVLGEHKFDALVSLEWMAKELFPDADIIPMLVFLTRTKAPARGGKIRLVHGLRSKADLERAATDQPFRAQHTSVLPLERWRALSPTGDWPLEVTAADLPILEKLRERPTWEKSRFALAQYAVKLGQEGQKCIRPSVPANLRRSTELPFIKGHHVCAFFVSEADELADLAQLGEAEDPSVWGGKWQAFWKENHGKKDENGLGRGDLSAGGDLIQRPSDITCAILPEIFVRLVACSFDPSLLVSNNSNSGIVPLRSSGFVVTGLLNSSLFSYCSFLTMRAAIRGRTRRAGGTKRASKARTRARGRARDESRGSRRRGFRPSPFSS
jgi:hypothetical protein